MNPNCLLFSQRERKRERVAEVQSCGGWSGGTMVMGKLSVPGRRTNLDNSRARACCACSRCGLGCLDIFLSFVCLSVFFCISPSSGECPT